MSKIKTIPDIEKFIGDEAIYDSHAQCIFGKNGEELQLIVDVRAWARIQKLFENTDGSVDFEKAEVYQDELGEWIADAINNKLNNN